MGLAGLVHGLLIRGLLGADGKLGDLSPLQPRAADGAVRRALGFQRPAELSGEKARLPRDKAAIEPGIAFLRPRGRKGQFPETRFAFTKLFFFL